jgi:hypothetical protein
VCQDLLEHLRPNLERHATFEEAAAAVAAIEAAEAAAAAAGLPAEDSDSDDDGGDSARRGSDSEREGARLPRLCVQNRQLRRLRQSCDREMCEWGTAARSELDSAWAWKSIRPFTAEAGVVGAGCCSMV